MILSGYKAAPSLPFWRSLEHAMIYVYHISHIPIMYPQKKAEEQKICAHHAKRRKIKDIKTVREHMGIQMYIYAELAKDIITRQSVTSVIHEYIEVVFTWKIVKNMVVVLHANGSEIRALFTGVKRANICIRFFESLIRATKGPIPTYEDNNAAIQKFKLTN